MGAMRIVAGKHAGRKLTSPGKKIRPTAESVRDQWLKRLKDDLPRAKVVDLFAGSGALGLEALSRGALYVDFVENGAQALHALKANVAALRESHRARIYKRDVIPFVESLAAGVYQIAFVDPPYGSRKLDRVMATWERVAFASILCVEHGREHRLPHGGRTRWHGDTGVTIYRDE